MPLGRFQYTLPVLLVQVPPAARGRIFGFFWTKLTNSHLYYCILMCFLLYCFCKMTVSHLYILLTSERRPLHGTSCPVCCSPQAAGAADRSAAADPLAARRSGHLYQLRYPYLSSCRAGLDDRRRLSGRGFSHGQHGHDHGGKYAHRRNTKNERRAGRRARCAQGGVDQRYAFGGSSQQDAAPGCAGFLLQ